MTPSNAAVCFINPDKVDVSPAVIQDHIPCCLLVTNCAGCILFVFMKICKKKNVYTTEGLYLSFPLSLLLATSLKIDNIQCVCFFQCYTNIRVDQRLNNMSFTKSKDIDKWMNSVSTLSNCFCAILSVIVLHHYPEMKKLNFWHTDKNVICDC